MRHLLLILTAEVLVAAPPVFEVTNRCPAFEVTNRCPAFEVTNKVPPPPAPQPEPAMVLVREYHPQLGGWVLVRRPALAVAAPAAATGECPPWG